MDSLLLLLQDGDHILLLLLLLVLFYHLSKVPFIGGLLVRTLKRAYALRTLTHHADLSLSVLEDLLTKSTVKGHGALPLPLLVRVEIQSDSLLPDGLFLRKTTVLDAPIMYVLVMATLRSLRFLLLLLSWLRLQLLLLIPVVFFFHRNLVDHLVRTLEGFIGSRLVLLLGTDWLLGFLLLVHNLHDLLDLLELYELVLRLQCAGE